MLHGINKIFFAGTANNNIQKININCSIKLNYIPT